MQYEFLYKCGARATDLSILHLLYSFLPRDAMLQLAHTVDECILWCEG